MFKKILLTMVTGSLMSCATTASSKENEVVLTKSNTIVMDSAFDDSSVAAVMVQARELHFAMWTSQPIYLVINSPGGSIAAGLELIDNLNALGRTVHTITLFSASMGFQTVQGVEGKRYITPSGTLMSHKASGGFRGEFPGQIDSRYNYWLRRLSRLDKIVVRRSKGKLTLKQYQDLYENEYWCEGQDCVDNGLADVVASVQCDYSLSGVREIAEGFSFMGLSVKTKTVKSECPLITGIFSQEAYINGKKVDLNDLVNRAHEYGITPNQALELKQKIEQTFAAHTNKKTL